MNLVIGMAGIGNFKATFFKKFQGIIGILPFAC